MSRAVIIMLLVAFMSLTACRSARRGEPVGRPVRVDSPALERGRMSFNQHCHRCHPGGEGGLGPSLNDKPAPAFLLKTQIRVGLGTMPRFDEKLIPSGELDDLVAYMKELRRSPR
jgi:mono/diheme cytochrome c family protein